MITLERAIAIAAQAHEGQLDRAGKAYILHPLRVMVGQDTVTAMIVAVLHDVLEDCPDWPQERLRAEGVTETMITALEALTKRSGEPYEDFVRRLAANPIARAVKRADLLDNLDASRLPRLTDNDQRRMEKYRAALRMLEAEHA